MDRLMIGSNANASSSTGGPSQEKPKKIEMDETMSFGSDFDPRNGCNLINTQSNHSSEKIPKS